MRLRIATVPGSFSVCRLDPSADIPPWPRGAFISITRTTDELSIVCESAGIPNDVRAEHEWHCFRVEGPIPFETTGVAAALVSPLAAEKISVFLVATYDTDYLLVNDPRAASVLRAAGHDVV